MSDIFRRFIKTGKVGTYSSISDSYYNIVQLKLIDMFNNTMKSYKSTYHAKDMRNEEETFRYIKKYHKQDTGPGGINENYQRLKDLIYYKDLKQLIQKFINSCEVCCRDKYDRRPIKP